jgi:hypothetical protein
MLSTTAFAFTFGEKVSASASHDCYYFGELDSSQGIGQLEANMLIANRETPEVMGLTPSEQPYMFFLKEDISWEGTFKAIDGIYMVVCKNGHTVNGQSSNEGVVNGGIYFLQCNAHYCPLVGETILSVDQSYVDLSTKFMERAEDGGLSFGEATFAIAEDITLGEDFVISADSSLTLCTNGHKVSGGENITANGGKYTEISCIELHTCELFEGKIPVLNQADVDKIVSENCSASVWAKYGLPEGFNDLFAISLAEDVTIDGTLSAPNGAMILLCLDGNEIVGNIDNTATSGVIVTFDCKGHLCDDCGEYVPLFGQDLIDALIAIHQGQPIEFDMGIALREDITLGEDFILASDSCFRVCTNGYNIIDKENATSLGGVLEESDCSGKHYCFYAGGNTSSVNQQAIDYIVANNSSDEVWAEFGIAQADQIYFCYVEEDITWEGTIKVPDGVYLVVCTNGCAVNGSVDNESTTGGIFFAQCGIHNCEATGYSTLCINQGYVDLVKKLILANSPLLSEMASSLDFALNGDVHFDDSGVWNYVEGVMNICTCGYKVTGVENVSARVNVYSCDEIGVYHTCDSLGSEKASTITQANLLNFVDENGYVRGTGRIVWALGGNIKLNRFIKVPAGVELVLCLNGFTLTSPRIITTTPLPSGVVEMCSSAIEVKYGAKLIVEDCKSTGTIVVDTNDMNGLGALFSSSILNYGTTIINGGTCAGMVGVLSGGELIINNGNVLGVVAGAMAVGGIEEEGAREGKIEINGGSINGMYGAVAQDGEVVLNDGVVGGLYIGLGDTIEAATGKGKIEINGGKIIVGGVDEEVLRAVGYAHLLDEIANSFEYEGGAAVAISSVLVFNRDIEIIYAPETEANKDYYADVLVLEDATPTIMAGDGIKIEKIYSVLVMQDGVGIIDESVLCNVTMKGETIAKINENGNYTVINSNGETFVPTAKLVSWTLSLKGAIRLNFYAQLDQAFIDTNSKLLITFKGEYTFYSIDQATPYGKYYIYSFDISPKDYQKQVVVSFTDGTNIWTGGSFYVDKYINNVLNDTTGTYDEQKELCKRLQEYCLAANTAFSEDVVTTYNLRKSSNGDVSYEDLESFKGVASGSANGLVFNSVTLLLKSSTQIRFYFKLKAGVALEDLTLTVDGVPVQAQKYSDTHYYIEILDITARNLGYKYKINLDGFEVEYCALSYVYALLKPGTADAVNEAVVKALYNYYVAAYEYFNS